MYIILLFLSAGVITGYLLRHKKKVIKIADRLSGYFIYFFLFLLGFSVGMNEEIIENFDIIGFKALLFAVVSVFGSIIVSFFVYKRYYREIDNEE